MNKSLGKGNRERIRRARSPTSRGRSACRLRRWTKSCRRPKIFFPRGPTSRPANVAFDALSDRDVRRQKDGRQENGRQENGRQENGRQENGRQENGWQENG